MKNIKNDLLVMFWEQSTDYANKNTPADKNEEDDNSELWLQLSEAYQQASKDVIDYVIDNYELHAIVPSEYCKCEIPDRETGYSYCMKCHKSISDARMRLLVGKDEISKEPAKEPDQEEIKRRLMRNDFEWNDICARATLYPGKSIEEVKHIQLEKRIEDTYKFVNDLLLNTKPMNTPETRKYVVELIQKRIDHQVIVRCNEENNSPDIIDQNLLIAELLWNLPYDIKEPQMLKSILVFGDKVAVENYAFQNFLDNETFKFISKGI